MCFLFSWHNGFVIAGEKYLGPVFGRGSGLCLEQLGRWSEPLLPRSENSSLLGGPQWANGVAKEHQSQAPLQKVKTHIYSSCVFMSVLAVTWRRWRILEPRPSDTINGVVVYSLLGRKHWIFELRATLMYRTMSTCMTNACIYLPLRSAMYCLCIGLICWLCAIFVHSVGKQFSMCLLPATSSWCRMRSTSGEWSGSIWFWMRLRQ